MSQPNAPMFVILSTENMTQTEVNEINQLTKELGAVLESQPEAVESVSMGGKNDLPQGTKVALEAILTEQIVICVAPIVTNWVLGKIEAGIKSISERIGRQIKAQVIVGSREVQITPKTTSQELNIAAQQIKAASELTPSKRYALVVGNSSYLDNRLPNLESAAVDAECFANILSDPNLGAFTEVQTLIDQPHDVIEKAIEKFFKNKLREDMLLLYFSGHGVKSQNGQLFLSAQNTSSDLLHSTGIAANFIKENMEESGSQRQILILDCCYGGAIIEGAKGNNVVGQVVDSLLSFKPSGFGKIIITASEAMQYAFDGKHVEGQTQNSLFTRYLIEGLQTGDADADNDGLIDIGELYQFAYRNVVPEQTPNISSTSQEGKMYIGLNPDPKVRLTPLSDQLTQAMSSESRLTRQGAVSELGRLLKSPDPFVSLPAERALRKMANDDSKSVADAAQEILNQHLRSQQQTWQTPAQAPIAPKSLTAISTPPPAVVVPPPPPSTNILVNIPPKHKNQNLGGLLNLLIPGAAQVYVGNWGRAILTFFVVMAFLFVLLIAFQDFYLCASALIIEFVYMFIAGRNIVIKYNRKIGT